MQLDPSQERALELMLAAPLVCVTGGAGTGKTSVTRVVLDRMDALGQRYLLAASTGKAARRLEEATRRSASTVHRLLEYGPWGRGGEWCFAKGAEDPIEADVVLVDEASMIDVELARALFDAIQPPTRLVLIGDAAQLPSVGPGRVFAELIESNSVPVARLTTLHRAARESWVCVQSQAILAGQMPELAPRPDFRWIECDDRDASVDALIDLVGRDRLASIGVNPEQAQVLVPQNVGRAGVDVINARLQELLNPPMQHGWRIGSGEGSRELRVGDRVIQCANDYLLQVMNGEIGVVERVGKDELEVRFAPTLLTSYDRERARNLRLAYALTAHKYQGSQTPWAIVLAHSTHTRMLSRQWLYTAVTRAMRGVVIVGDRLGLERAVANARDAKRNTSLVERLRERRAA